MPASSTHSAPPPAGPLLAVDGASPLTSVAVGDGRGLLAKAAAPTAASADLLRMIDTCLREAGLAPADLAGLVALRGPGSFTGSRVGLATVLALHRALGTPAIALSNLEVLAMAAGAPGRVVAVVDALRGEWLAAAFEIAERPLPDGPSRLVDARGLLELRPGRVIGFALGALRDLDDWPAEIPLIEAPPLAAAALDLAATGGSWDVELLARPLYSRQPAAARP